MQYGDAVIYVRDGQSLNALVAQSFQTEDGEILNLIYLDPDARALGNQRMANFVQSAFSVKPLVEGAKFGWESVYAKPSEAPKTPGDVFADAVMQPLIDLSRAVIAIDPSLEISPDGTLKSAKTLLEKFKSMQDSEEKLEVQLAGCMAAANGATSDVALKGSYGWSPAYQDVLDLRGKYETLRAKLSAPEQLDAVQGPVSPGDPDSPHAINPIMPTDPTSVASVDDAKAAALAAQINANLGK